MEKEIIVKISGKNFGEWIRILDDVKINGYTIQETDNKVYINLIVENYEQK